MDERLQFMARRLAGESMAEAERHLAEASKHAAKRMVSFVKIFDRWGTGALAASTGMAGTSFEFSASYSVLGWLLVFALIFAAIVAAGILINTRLGAGTPALQPGSPVENRTF